MFRLLRKLRKNRSTTVKHRTKLQVESLEDRLLLASGFDFLPVLELDDSFTSRTPHFTAFEIIDASGDDTPQTVFYGGALRVNYDFNPYFHNVNKIVIEAWQGNKKDDMKVFDSTHVSNGLIGLPDTNTHSLLAFPAGSYSMRARAELANGLVRYSDWRSMDLLTTQTTTGTFEAELFEISTMKAQGMVIHGQGGTDTLRLDVSRQQVASINGMILYESRQLLKQPKQMFDPTAGGQAIYKGTLVDYIRLNDGREIYFTGIERLEFADDSALDLLVQPTDANFVDQWNLHVTDVPSAWRFTTGSSGVLLVSLDTGVLPTTRPDGNPSGGITDLDLDRLITDDTAVDIRPVPTPWEPLSQGYGHGHMAISVMAATANNTQNGLPGWIAGINWDSDVYVANVYHSDVTLQDAIRAALDYAEDNDLRVVFQGGIQDEVWLTEPLASGGTQQALEDMIRDAADYSLFAIAAGNGGPGGNIDDPNYLNSVSGVAAFETTHDNVMSVGALERTADNTAFGLANAADVNLADYSNRGSNLTIVAPTDVPATGLLRNDVVNYSGTSAANPQVAAIASLVWSINPNLTGAQVRDILTETAMDLGDAGRDNTFGHGLINADLAVRRALGLAQDPELANLSKPSFVPILLASRLRIDNGFRFSSNLYENAFGLKEKWFQDRHDVWHIITPDGHIQRWHGGRDFSEVATVSPMVYSNLGLLFDAPVELSQQQQDQLSQVREAHGFHSTGNLYENTFGLNEKWFQDRQQQWYIMTPDGQIQRWLGRRDFDAIAKVTPLAFDDLGLLLQAQVADQLGQLRRDFGFRSDGNFYENAFGLKEKWFKDRHDVWHIITPDGQIQRWHGGRDFSLVDTVNSRVWTDSNLLFTARVTLPQTVQIQLTELSEAYGFRSDGNLYENIFGLKEKWFQDANKGWHIITADGRLQRWHGDRDFSLVAIVDSMVWDDPSLLFDM